MHIYLSSGSVANHSFGAFKYTVNKLLSVKTIVDLKTIYNFKQIKIIYKMN